MGLLDKLETMLNNFFFSTLTLISFLLMSEESHTNNNNFAHDAYIEFLSDCNLDVLSLGSTTGTIKIKASKITNGSGKVGFRVYEPMRYIYGTSIIRGLGVFREDWTRWVVDYVLFPRSSYTASMSHPNTILTWDYNIHYVSSFGNPQLNRGARIWVTGPATLNFLEGTFRVVIGSRERVFQAFPGSPISFSLT